MGIQIMLRQRFNLHFVFFAACAALAAMADNGPIEATERGVIVRTDRYTARIADGMLVGFLNAFTGEEYLYQRADLDKVRPHLPGGLGNQHGEAALAAAASLHEIVWGAHDPAGAQPNQRYADSASEMNLERLSNREVVLHYKGLTDGLGSRFPDDVYRLRVAIAEDTGDLMLTASGSSPDPGVYGVNVTVAPVDRPITVEAPIFCGIRLTHDMTPRLWRNHWPTFWDYPFLAFNGREKGAVGLWAADPELRYKELYYLVNDQGISVSLGTMGLPPYEERREVEGVTWHLQAFDHHWAQAAARYRAWRDAHYPMAERPEWTRRISFVNNGVNASPMWLNMLSNFFGGENLDRTATFGTTIRAANFDTMHYDNRPYEQFAEHMKAWREAGAIMMAYLNPVIMWDRRGNQELRISEEERDRIIQLARNASIIRAFSGRPFKPHLGDPDWLEWFLPWVREYIQEHGSQGVYHDETYVNEIDRRGLVNGMTPQQGMANYFIKVNQQNPDSIHATEHLNDVNLIGASLGIGAGIHWGVASDGMRMQRIKHPSPVSAALAYPWGAIWDFPHFSDIFSHRSAMRHHWGMNQHERRAQIAGLFIQGQPLYRGEIVPYDQWRNELQLNRVRALTFVREGLRPTFPEDWQRGVYSYHRSADGGDFRYVATPWGSKFVRQDTDGPKMLSGRIHGVYSAELAGGIAHWAFYNEGGPAGLNPDRYYAVFPDIARPAAYISGMSTDTYVACSYVNDTFLFADFAVYEPMLNILPRLTLTLHAPSAPAGLLVDGKPAVIRAEGGETYSFGVTSSANVVVWLRELESGPEAAVKSAVLRMVSDLEMDQFDADWLSANRLVAAPLAVRGETGQIPGLQLTDNIQSLFRQFSPRLLIPFRSGEAGSLTIHLPPRVSLEAVKVNGMAMELTRGQLSDGPIEITFSGDESILLELHPGRVGPSHYGLHWQAANDD